MPHIELKAGNFHYKDSGGDGPAVVFSHGFLMDHEMFEMQVADLQSDYRCIAWDEPYHGDTHAEGDFSYWDYANFLLELLDHLGVDRFFHVGMSQGGFLGLRLALTAPERVRGLVFIDSQAGPEDPEAVPMYEAMIQQWVAGEEREALAGTVAQLIVGGPIDPAYWVSKWLARDPADLPVIFRTLAGREDLHPRLGEIACPALVLHGDQDMAIPMEPARELAEGLPNCGDVVVIEGGGHSSNMADPMATNQAIRSFLRANT